MTMQGRADLGHGDGPITRELFGHSDFSCGAVECGSSAFAPSGSGSSSSRLCALPDELPRKFRSSATSEQRCLFPINSHYVDNNSTPTISSNLL
jgi:hypothetical protein